jgi:hypothetical protein
MADGDQENARGVLAAQRLGQLGVEVKLDKGFAQGTYCVYVEFDGLAARSGFAAAHRTARAYCALLKGHLGQLPGCQVGEIEDASRTEDPRRKRDLESTFLSFAIETGDGQCHDEHVREQFQVASLRAGQAWDQSQAKEQARRRDHRQEKFRGQLASLLDGPAYMHLDAATKERLLSEVPALAFPVRGLER